MIHLIDSPITTEAAQCVRGADFIFLSLCVGSGVCAAEATTTTTPAVPPTEGSTSSGETKKKPVVCIVIGMAGSGKTTLMQRLNAHLHMQKQPPYVINLDPATASIPFGTNIDIRDTVKYKEVMKQYSLGPNGGIMTALNLFATRFDQLQYTFACSAIDC
jgi:hypothetical protein